MGMRVNICKDLTVGANSAGLPIRLSQPPYRFTAEGGFTGNVTLEHSPSPAPVADADATWIQVATMANGAQISEDSPFARLRVRGTHSAGTGTVRMLENVRRTKRTS